ncbi:MAG: CRISPR-associated helicase/endonuclease Cas3 [Inhella sp.]
MPAAAELIAAARRLFAAPAAGESPLARSLALRMLFSALVDADFLDTEQHFDADRAAQRAQFPPLSDYRKRLDGHLDGMAARLQSVGQAEHPVQQARAAVLSLCRAKADEAPGVFSLNVPTGGGKTLSSLAFALRHAERHGLRRVIYAIPYTSIIEQTAAVFAGVFGDEALIEHHSQAEAGESDETRATRLAAENWDAPLIVTTNVQLFESLFAVRTSRCRKLHRLAGSVIVLDEAQMLPPDFLQPILHALNALLARYRISLALCTATQPDLQGFTSGDPRRGLCGLPAPRAIIERPERLAEQLRRTRIHWPQDLQTPICRAVCQGQPDPRATGSA